MVVIHFRKQFLTECVSIVFFLAMPFPLSFPLTEMHVQTQAEHLDVRTARARRSRTQMAESRNDR